MGTLALLAILARYGLGQLPPIGASEPGAKPSSGWSEAGRQRRAFAVSSLDPLEKTEPYTILRHPQGGRKDILRWSVGDRLVAELGIYRPGGEFDAALSPEADIAAQMGITDNVTLETAGLIDSKFGTVALLQPTSVAGEALSCLGFVKRIEDPALELSDWSCQGGSLPARRGLSDIKPSRWISCNFCRQGGLLSAGVAQ